MGSPTYKKSIKNGRILKAAEKLETDKNRIIILRKTEKT